MAKGPSGSGGSRDPRVSEPRQGDLPAVPVSGPGAASAYTGSSGGRSPRSMTGYSGTHNPIGKR